MPPSVSLTNNLLLAISDAYGRSACVQRINVIVARTHNRTVRSATPGTADVVGVVESRAIACEIKAGRDRMRPAQLLFQQAWERAGGIYLIVRDVDQAMAELRERLGRG